MRKVFEVELSSQDGFCAELTLPATPYALLDAVEKLELADGEAPQWELLSAFDAGYIFQHMDQDNGSLSELNALARQFARLSESEITIFEGLAAMERIPMGQSVPLSRLIDLVYSTDCCHLVVGVVTDAQLGRFCAENGFIPEAEGLSDEAFALLDFGKIGRDFREAEGGVFTRGGYVQRREELKQVYKTLDLTLEKPDYTLLAETASGVQIKLPGLVGVTVVDEPAQCLDCAAPSLIGLTAMVSTLDMLARRLTELDGELTKYKAVLEATGYEDISRALTLADELDRYRFDPEPREPDEVAAGHLKGLLPEEELAALLSHVNLYRYGQAVMEQDGGKLTGYGYVQPSIGPSQDMEQGQESDEMRMM